MEKTISYLNSKLLYRLIKVLFIFSLLGILAVLSYFSYSFLSSIDHSNTYVTCNDARIITSDDLIESGISVNDSINPDDEDKVKTICAHPFYKSIERSFKERDGEKLTETQLLYMRNKYGITTMDKINYRLERNYNFTVHDNANPKNVMKVIGIFIGIIAFFEIIRRVFYYVVLGSIKPKK